ncbi:PRY1 (predicted) [Pycnogonum litorale]
MLAAHNEKRRLFNAGNVNAENGIFPQAASTIPDLKWNSDLAVLAQAHSKKCKFEHSTGNSLPDFSYIGENLYTSSGSDSCDTLPDWSNAVAPWYSEIDDFASQDQICNVGRTYVHQSSPALGHFTQIIWQKTTDIGCGIAACDGGSIIITCNYGPGGNFGNQPVYEFGTCPPPA